MAEGSASHSTISTLVNPRLSLQQFKLLWVKVTLVMVMNLLGGVFWPKSLYVKVLRLFCFVLSAGADYKASLLLGQPFYFSVCISIAFK